MQKVCVSSRLTQKLKSEELPWRNPWWARCDIHAGVACGLVWKMQMWTQSRWGSGASRYKSRSFSRKEPRQAEPSRAHQAEQWPKLCIVQSLLSLERSNRGVDKPWAVLPIHVLAWYWAHVPVETISIAKHNNWVLFWPSRSKVAEFTKERKNKS